MIGTLEEGNIKFFPLTGNRSSYSGPSIGFGVGLGDLSRNIFRISLPSDSLGTGLLTAFFKHMQYEGLDLLVR